MLKDGGLAAHSGQGLETGRHRPDATSLRCLANYEGDPRRRLLPF